MERSIDPQLSVLPGTRLPPATHSQPPFEIPPRQSSLRSTLDAQSLKRKFLDSDEKLAKLDAMSYTDLVDLRDQINTKIKQRKTRMQTEYSQSEGERGTYKYDNPDSLPTLLEILTVYLGSGRINLSWNLIILVQQCSTKKSALILSRLPGRALKKVGGRQKRHKKQISGKKNTCWT